MDQATHNTAATAHSKNAIAAWLVFGLGYNLLTHNLVSISSVLIFLPGIFLASFASILTYLIKKKKHKVVPDTNNVLVLLFFTVTTILSAAFIPALAVLAAFLLHSAGI